MSDRRDRGAAVVLAMLLAAFAAAVAATVFADQQRWSRSVLHRGEHAQAQVLAMAGVQWSRQILHDDARRSVIDHLGEPWAMTLPPIPLDNGEIRGAITDAQARLNVNALGGTGTGAATLRAWIARLFAQRGGPVGALDAIADWIDADGIVRPEGAEDAHYAAQPASGVAANAPLVRTMELAAVKGVAPRALAAVAPHIAALPSGTPVNVNTASPEVLGAMVENVSGDALAALVADRARKPFTTVAEFRARLPQDAVLRGEESLSVRSSFFYVSVEARQGTTRARARALLRRTDGDWPAVVWQIVE
jgi:general secretion pathway protein K